MSDAKLVSTSSYSAAGYIPSLSARGVADLSSIGASTLKLKLHQYRSEIVILSNEGWGNRSDIFSNSQILERLGLDCHVILYVRPQVGWYNSAWWQWGAWTGKTLDHWVRENLDKACWADVVTRWRQVPGVAKVTVRVLPRDILTDFYSLLGAQPPIAEKINSSLPGSVLRIFQRYPWLRQGAHDSAIEFSIGRHIKFAGAASPWVIPPELARLILERNLQGNKDLLHLLDDDQKQLFEEDPAWWSLDYYADRQAEEAGKVVPVGEESDKVAAMALKALADLDEKYRVLVKDLESLKRRNAGGKAINSFLSRFR